MSPFVSAAFFVIGAVFAVAALLCVYRIVVGPSILDRMIASDVLLTTLMLVLGAEMVYNGHTRTVPVILVLAATAVFATIAVARYVSRQDLSTHPGAGRPEAGAAGAADSAARSESAFGFESAARSESAATDPDAGRR